MGCDELIEALRKEEEGKTREIWEEAEEEAGKIRADLSPRIETLRRDNAAGQSSDEVSRMLLEAETAARVIRLTAYDRLSVRLYSLAASSLHLLREKGYEEIFERLALELPSFGWQRVTVNPDDLALARRSFPGAEIVADKSIMGGMEAEAEEGGVKIVNTFEKRLERSWTEMLSALLGDINRGVMDNGTTSDS
jgi:V/A-type H+/Na+-transporting ATPase subunit E